MFIALFFNRVAVICFFLYPACGVVERPHGMGTCVRAHSFFGIFQTLSMLK